MHLFTGQHGGDPTISFMCTSVCEYVPTLAVWSHIQNFLPGAIFVELVCIDMMMSHISIAD